MSPTIHQSRTRCPKCRSAMLFDGWWDAEGFAVTDGSADAEYYTVCNNCGWDSRRKAPKKEGTR